MPLTSKGPLSTEEADQSIDEILGLQVLEKLVCRSTSPAQFCRAASFSPFCVVMLFPDFLLQGELHMSDDAIHDILEQTESDPAFQALYDLFDYSNQ